MVVALFPAIVMLLGLVLWAMKGKLVFWGEVGKYMFIVGLYYVVGAYAHTMTHIGSLDISPSWLS